MDELPRQRAGDPAGLRVDRQKAVQIGDRGSRDARERPLDDLGDGEEGQGAVEEARDRDLVGGVQDARRGPPASPALRASPRAGNASSSGGENSRISPAVKSRAGRSVAARSG